METENRKSKTLVGVSKEVDATEESMEYWFNRGVSDVEEGEVVRGRVVEVRDSEILVDIGYKSEGTIPIEEFRHAGSLPKVGEEIEVYLESKEDNEGLIVLSKDKADKIKVWDQISKAHDSGTPVEGRVAEVVKGGLAVDVGVRAFLPGSQVDLRPVKNLAAMVGFVGKHVAKHFHADRPCRGQGVATKPLDAPTAPQRFGQHLHAAGCAFSQRGAGLLGAQPRLPLRGGRATQRICPSANGIGALLSSAHRQPGFHLYPASCLGRRGDLLPIDGFGRDLLVLFNIAQPGLEFA